MGAVRTWIVSLWSWAPFAVAAAVVAVAVVVHHAGAVQGVAVEVVLRPWHAAVAHLFFGHVPPECPDESCLASLLGVAMLT